MDRDIFGRRENSGEYIRCEIHTGTAPGERFIDFCNVVFGAGGLCIGAPAGSAKAAVIPAQSAQAFTLAAPLQVDVMTSVAVR